MFENSVNIMGREAETLSVSTTAASTEPLQPGIYALWSDEDTYIRVSKTSADAETVDTDIGLKITANTAVFPVRVQSEAYLGAIAGSNGNLYYHLVG